MGSPDLNLETKSPEALAAEVAEYWTEKLGQPISPPAAALAAKMANMVDASPFVPEATLVYVCELAVKLEGRPVLELAGALIELVKATAEAHSGNRPKFRR